MHNTQKNINGSPVSIVIPTYNRKESLGKAIESVLGQTYKNTEIIVIDDDSTDGTREMIFELVKNNPNIIFIKNDVNLGLVKTLNKGIVAASGEYIARLDDDDYWCDAQKLKKQVEFLENNPDYVLVGGGAVKMDQRGKEVIRYLLPEKDFDIRKRMLLGDVFVHVAVVFRKTAWEKIKGYRENFDGIEDWDAWLNMGLLGKLYNIPEILVAYSGHDKNEASYFEKKYTSIKRLKMSTELIKKYRNNYPGYKKALVYCWLRYGYSFLPFKEQSRLMMFKLKRFLS